MAGEYSFSKGDNIFKLIQKLSTKWYTTVVNIPIHYYQITLIEGSTIDELVDLFKNNHNLTKNKYCEDKKLLEWRMSKFFNWDGPDTEYEDSSSLEGMYRPDNRRRNCT